MCLPGRYAVPTHEGRRCGENGVFLCRTHLTAVLHAARSRHKRVDGSDPALISFNGVVIMRTILQARYNIPFFAPLSALLLLMEHAVIQKKQEDKRPGPSELTGASKLIPASTGWLNGGALNSPGTPWRRGMAGYRALQAAYAQGFGLTRYGFRCIQRGPIVGATVKFRRASREIPTHLQRDFQDFPRTKRTGF